MIDSVRNSLSSTFIWAPDLILQGELEIQAMFCKISHFNFVKFNVKKKTSSYCLVK